MQCLLCFRGRDLKRRPAPGIKAGYFSRAIKSRPFSRADRECGVSSCSVDKAVLKRAVGEEEAWWLMKEWAWDSLPWSGGLWFSQATDRSIRIGTRHSNVHQAEAGVCCLPFYPCQHAAAEARGSQHAHADRSHCNGGWGKGWGIGKGRGWLCVVERWGFIGWLAWLGLY